MARKTWMELWNEDVLQQQRERQIPTFILEDETEILSEGEDKNAMKLMGFKKAAVINVCDRTCYYALYDETIKKGDKVLVSGALYGKVHTITDIVTTEDALLEVEKPLCEEVICKVDTSAYDARVKQREQKAKLRKLMEATVAQMDEVDKFRVYADHNPEMAKLLAQYNEINV